MKYHYPAAGGLPAPTGCQLIILTAGGQHIMGRWREDGGFLGWCYPPGRDAAIEDWIGAHEIELALGIL